MGPKETCFRKTVHSADSIIVKPAVDVALDHIRTVVSGNPVVNASWGIRSCAVEVYVEAAAAALGSAEIQGTVDLFRALVEDESFRVALTDLCSTFYPDLEASGEIDCSDPEQLVMLMLAATSVDAEFKFRRQSQRSGDIHYGWTRARSDHVCRGYRQSRTAFPHASRGLARCYTAGCIFLDQPPRIAPRGPAWGAIGSRRAFFRNAIVDRRLNHCETRCRCSRVRQRTASRVD